jgi:hypothetical protein
MRKTSRLAIGLALTGFIVFTSTAAGQTLRMPPNRWDHGTKLSVFGGAAMASPETRGAFGTAIGWEINRRFELEGTGSWLVARHGDDAFAAELKLSGNLTPPRAVVPFVAAGVGLYHASFDTTRGPLPDFYQRRLPASAIATLVGFNDPSFVFAGGANIFAGTHVSIRPDLSVRIATRSSSAFVVTMATVYVSYHFEKHDAVGN